MITLPGIVELNPPATPHYCPDKEDARRIHMQQSLIRRPRSKKFIFLKHPWQILYQLISMCAAEVFQVLLFTHFDQTRHLQIFVQIRYMGES